MALGDSSTTGSGAPPGEGWVDAYAQLIRDGQRKDVEVHNLAVNGTTSVALLSRLTTSATTRDALAAADIVVIGCCADLNAGDEALFAGECEGTDCYEQILNTFDENVDAIVSEVVAIRGAKPTVIRAITPPNVLPGAEDVIPEIITAEIGLYQTRRVRDGICAAMEAHGGECIDSMTAFNGPDGTGDAYRTGLITKTECCYPTAEGQRLMAELLYDTGLAPLVDSR